MNNSERLASLHVHRMRLSELIGELLARADEIDQAAKYDGKTMDELWHKRFAVTCQDLAKLSQTVFEIEKLIKAGSADAAQRALLKATDIASNLSQRLRDIKTSVEASL